MGLVAAERLGGIGAHQLTPELADRIAQADTVIFLDADATVAPGEISVKAVEPTDGTLDHQATPGGLLLLVRMVYGAIPKSWLIGMGGEDFDLREGLTAAAERAVERAVAFVRSSS